MRSLQSASSLRGKLGSLTVAWPGAQQCASSLLRPTVAQSVLCHRQLQQPQRRWLARPADVKVVQHLADELPSKNVWFRNASTSFGPASSDAGHFFDHKPVDQRKLKLGKTIRILRDRLPTLLATPLPQELISPQITLRLFPSTHPHLPKVTGRIAYTAALWTSPVAWGRVPVVGNVKLVILSERMVSSGLVDASSQYAGGEKLIVRWKTCGTGGSGIAGAEVTEQIKKMMAILGGNGHDKSSSSNTNTKRAAATATAAGSTGAVKNKDFTGLFLFEFDDEGRISSHTIEHVEEGNNWERTAKVISVTDWLLGRAWAKKSEGEPAVAFCQQSDDGQRFGGSRLRR